MRLFWEVARRGFRRYSSYRAAALAGLFTNVVFGFLRVAVLLVLFDAEGTVGGYDATDAVTYVWLTQGLIMVVHIWAPYDLALRIRSGDIATDLYRPVDLQAYGLAEDVGRSAFHLLARGATPLVVAAFFFTLRFPTTVAQVVLFAASVILAVVVSYALRFLLNLTAFWLLDYRGVAVLANVSWMFLGGFFVPLAIFPDGLAAVARALPFASIVQTPIDVFLGQPAGGTALALGLQAFWAVALLAAGRLVWARATTRLVVQGG